jgi:hypothetical protein
MAPAVAGEPGLYRGELWLMSVGAYSIEVRIAGAAGEGAVRIPVNSVATHQLPLPPLLRDALLALGALLACGGLAIVYTAAGESVLAAGSPMQRADRRKGLAAAAVTAVVFALALAGGWHWWQAEEGAFRRTLREGAWPDLNATVEARGSSRILHLAIGEKAFKPDYALPLLPDHGKLLHLFLIREPAHDVFAHLHPVRRSGKDFDLALPPLPEGQYRIFCDLTLADSGLSSTASSTVTLPPLSPPEPAANSPAPDPSSLRADPDDSWFIPSAKSSAPPPGTDATFPLPGGREAIWKAHSPLHAQHDAHLEFLFHDAAGQPLPLEPYMGMLSHAAILRADGKVFAHLHPTGNYSMAAEAFFTSRFAREAARASGSPVPPEMDHASMHHSAPGEPPPASILLPYEFPSAGDYRIWVQVKIGGQILTATFPTSVLP